MKFDGQSGGGRPAGVRNRLSHAFLTDVMAHWKEIGPQALKLAYRNDPLGYVRMVAGILPREFTLEHTTSGLSAEERDELIVQLRQHLLTVRAQQAELVCPGRAEPVLIETKVTNGRE